MAKMLCFPSECICLLFFPSFWLCHVICTILVPWPGIEPTALAVKAWIPNHWTARVFPCLQFRSEIRQIDKQHSRQTIIRFRKNRKCKKSSKQGKSEWRIMEGFIEEIAFGLTLLRVGWILASTDGRVNFKSGLVAKNGLDAGIEPRSPALQADSLPAKPQGKPKNTGVGSLSLLQLIFPT